MKLKEILFGLGFKPPLREYSFDLDSFVLPREGELHYARWRHPKERRKEFPQENIDALRKFVKPGDAVIDIGAHTGDSTLPLALAVGPTGCVFALEPNPYAFKVLLANSALNRTKTNIYPLMFAATPQDGEFEFEYSDAGFCNGGLHQGVSPWKHAHFFKLRVTGKHLVKYLKANFPNELPKVRYVKMDTEGFDRHVAASLRELLRQNRPFLRSEIFQHVPEAERRAYHTELRELGYRVHKFNAESDPIGQMLEPADLMRWKQFDIFAIPERSSESRLPKTDCLPATLSLSCARETAQHAADH